jgi:hypothetical protein
MAKYGKNRLEPGHTSRAMKEGREARKEGKPGTLQAACDAIQMAMVHRAEEIDRQASKGEAQAAMVLRQLGVPRL